MSHDPEAERALVERACAGDVRSIDALFELHHRTIYRFVLGRIFGNHDDAEDITSAVFEKMVKALPRYEYRGRPFISWLYQIAVNEANDHGRRKQARPSSPIMDMDVADPHSGPEGLVEQRLMLGDVYEAMQHLPEAQRRVLELRFGADRSVRETAQILNKSENNVKVLQHKALERLKKLLGGK
jgi:RNA polymerase sigma-70 factor, ECF subfamily